MDEISKKIFGFFDKFSEPHTAIELAKDWGRLLAILKMRIYNEEKYLLPKFETEINN